MTHTPNLQAAAMRTRAAEIADQHRDRRTTEYDCGWDSCASSVRGNILALPLEADHAELLAEAMKLPEVRALVSAAQDQVKLHRVLRPYGIAAEKTDADLRAALAPFARKAGV